MYVHKTSDQRKKSSRSILITGGNSGIGLAIAEKMLAEGHRVAITYRNQPSPNSKLLNIKCEVTDINSIEETFSYVEEKQGNVEILISNAGIIDNALLLQMRDEQFTEVINTNLVSAFRLTKRAIPSMISEKFGRLIFIGSVIGKTGAIGQANYAASKAGLIGFTRSISRELASRHITANLVAPGFIETKMTSNITTKFRQSIIESTPIGRFGHPEEVASAVSWLSSTEASFVTGVVLPIDGGFTLG